jgi:hypothetical protein
MKPMRKDHVHEERTPPRKQKAVIRAGAKTFLDFLGFLRREMQGRGQAGVPVQGRQPRGTAGAKVIRHWKGVEVLSGGGMEKPVPIFVVLRGCGALLIVKFFHGGLRALSNLWLCVDGFVGVQDWGHERQHVPRTGIIPPCCPEEPSIIVFP